LRHRRQQLAPDAAATELRRKRRVDGLRREDVAYRAGISFDWYSRIELGKGAAPSATTLRSIARALELSVVDTRYIFELAGLPMRATDDARPAESLAAIEHVILELTNSAATLYDLYGSPLCWNAASDAISHWSTYPDAFSRNSIIIGLHSAYSRHVMGDEFDQVARGVVGVFRRAYTMAEEPPPLARRIYEYASGQPLFRTYWNENSVAEGYTVPGPVIRNIPPAGAFRLNVNDVVPVGRTDLFLRFLTPHDDETRDKFPRLLQLGTPGRLRDPDQEFRDSP
jgi:transcriptional regulator with XRE-family HTH domain